MSQTTILPIFEHFPKEAEIIGRILAGYGELEYDLTMCLREVLDNLETAIATLFRTKGVEQRIGIADALMRAAFEDAGLGPLYYEAIADISHCRKIRNQFAHCHWDFGHKDFLHFVNLERSAQKARGQRVRLNPVTYELLVWQEQYFIFVHNSLWYLAHEYPFRVRGKPTHDFVMPTKLARPPLHNGAPESPDPT